MSEKKSDGFTITDRRKFTSEGEIRPDAPREEEASSNRTASQATTETELRSAETKVKEFPKKPAEDVHEEHGERVSAAQQRASADAYKQSAKQFDQQFEGELKKAGRSSKDFEMTFEKLVASLYTTALVQLGLDPQSGAMRYQPDIMAARQTVDMLAVLSEKTKGNLDSSEERLLESVLYELRMAYIEITKVLTQPPPAKGDEGKA